MRVHVCVCVQVIVCNPFKSACCHGLIPNGLPPFCTQGQTPAPLKKFYCDILVSLQNITPFEQSVYLLEYIM